MSELRKNQREVYYQGRLKKIKQSNGLLMFPEHKGLIHAFLPLLMLFSLLGRFLSLRSTPLLSELTIVMMANL